MDRLTIVAHDRFQDIVDEANRGGYTFSTINICVDIPEAPKQAVTVSPVLETLLGIAPHPVQVGQPGEAGPAGVKPKPAVTALDAKFKKPEEIAAARLVLDAIAKVAHDPKTVLGPKALQTREVQNVLLFHQRQISTLVHTQMQPHAWQEASSYEAFVSRGFLELRTQAFAASANEPVRSFGTPINKKSDIRQMLFGGFKKCLYLMQKFDSDPERRFAEILEREPAVSKWFKPGKGVFQIRYTADNDYEPDFVVETETGKLLCGPKRADQMQDPVVLAKARAAATWCKHASAHETAHDEKPWRYVLIPHDAIADNMTLDGLTARYAKVDT